MRAKRLSRLISVVISAVMLVTTIPTFTYSLSVSAPIQYQEVKGSTPLEVKWSAPAGKTVDHYTLSLRRWIYNYPIDEKYSTLIYNRIVLPASRTSYTIPAYIIGEDYKFRLSVCAVLTDGTEDWSNEYYFYVSFHNGMANDKMIFFIWQGFESETQNQMKAAGKTWNDALPSRRLSVGPPTDYEYFNVDSADGINRITAAEPKPQEAYSMLTNCWFDSSGKCVEADINVNKRDYQWANSAQPGHVDVQSSITHEFGHVLGLNDKYESWASEWTMYGGVVWNSTQKRTLEYYDLFHLRLLYN